MDGNEKVRLICSRRVEMSARPGGCRCFNAGVVSAARVGNPTFSYAGSVAACRSLSYLPVFAFVFAVHFHSYSCRQTRVSLGVKCRLQQHRKALSTRSDPLTWNVFNSLYFKTCQLDWHILHDTRQNNPTTAIGHLRQHGQTILASKVSRVGLLWQ